MTTLNPAAPYSRFAYSVNEFQFAEMVEEIWAVPLPLLHRHAREKYPEIFQAGVNDSSTEFHRTFYETVKHWPTFVDKYRKFVYSVAKRLLGIQAPTVLYQKLPTFRVHLPGNVAVGGFHRDRDYRHPIGELNFIIPLTTMWGTNSTQIMTNSGLYEPVVAGIGDLIWFDGNDTLHGNYPNDTGYTRVSMDFRLLSVTDYERSLQSAQTSLTTGTKFTIGGYYREMEL